MVPSSDTRRTFLATLGTISAGVIAGCLTSSTSFEYPTNFAEDGVDRTAPFGFGSPMDELDSVQIDVRASFTVDDEEMVSEASGKISKAENEYVQTTSDGRIEETEGFDVYFDDPIEYRRIRYEEGEIEYLALEMERSFREFTQLEQMFDMTEEVSFDHVETDADADPIQAIYEAELEPDMTNSWIESQTEQGGPFLGGEMAFKVDEAGKVHTFEAETEFEEVIISVENKYKNFNEVSVTAPEWRDEAKDAT